MRKICNNYKINYMWTVAQNVHQLMLKVALLTKYSYNVLYRGATANLLRSLEDQCCHPPYVLISSIFFICLKIIHVFFLYFL